MSCQYTQILAAAQNYLVMNPFRKQIENNKMLCFWILAHLAGGAVISEWNKLESNYCFNCELCLVMEFILSIYLIKIYLIKKKHSLQLPTATDKRHRAFVDRLMFAGNHCTTSFLLLFTFCRLALLSHHFTQQSSTNILLSNIKSIIDLSLIHLLYICVIYLSIKDR